MYLYCVKNNNNNVNGKFPKHGLARPRPGPAPAGLGQANLAY